MSGSYRSFITCNPGQSNLESTMQPFSPSAPYGVVNFAGGWGKCYDVVTKQYGLAVVTSGYVLDSEPVISQPIQVPTVNVTAEIFVGAVLVVCFVMGWIAGAQR